MAQLTPPDLARTTLLLDSMLGELKRRATNHSTLEGYYLGTTAFPAAIQVAKLTKAYQRLMPAAQAPWASLVVDSTQDRLEIAGIRTDDSASDDAIWKLWQANQMDAEFKVAQSSALIDGRAFALVWPGENGPEVYLDNAATMIVRYREGSRRHREAALRRWKSGAEYVTLYLPDRIEKYRQVEKSEGLIEAGGSSWVPYQPPEDEAWPVPNDFGVVPVVEIAINRRLRPGYWASARGEFEHCLGLLDRINLLTFLGLVVAFWMGFPLRGVIGERILRDDDGEVIPPFDATAGGLAQLENPNAKPFEYKTADRSNLAVFDELDQLATITKTPRHYFPLAQGMSNLSADAIRASEGGQNAKVTSYKATIGEGGEEIFRLLGRMAPEPIDLGPAIEVIWKDHESRSMAERADAATKVASLGLPWQAIAEHYLNWTQEEIQRAETGAAGNALATLLGRGGTPPPPAVPAPAAQ